MSDDPIRHRAIADNLAARLRACSIAEQQLIERALGSLEGVRGGDTFGRRWERRIATGPGDVDRSWHLANDRGAIVRTACNGSWGISDPIETVDSPPLAERCTTCWREAVQGDALGLALIDARGELAAEERAKEGLREAAREEMLGAPVRILEPAIVDGRAVLRESGPRDTPRHPAADLQAAAKARVDRERRTVCETVSIGNVPGDGGEPMPLPTVASRHLALVDEPDRVVADEFELEQHLTPGDAEEPLWMHGPGELGGEGG